MASGPGSGARSWGRDAAADWLARALMLALVVAAALQLAAPARAAPALASADVARRLASGKAVTLRNATLRGDLDLGDVARVRGSFRCLDCRLEGSLLGEDVVFEQTVNLSGSEIAGRVALEGATFQAPALFGSPPGNPASFLGRVDLKLATFEDLVSFQQAAFMAPADFTLARFRDDVVFAQAELAGGASFDSAVFAGRTRFDRSSFGNPGIRLRPARGQCEPGGVSEGRASFERAAFRAAADFRAASFQGDACFRAADFEGRADFSQAEFTKQAIFDLARFSQEATFRGAEFIGESSQLAGGFDRVRALGLLEFTAATFANQTFFTNIVAPRLSITDAHFEAPKPPLVITDISAEDFVMDVDSIEAVQDQGDVRERVLELIESGAKARGDLVLANDAHYRLEVLRSNDYAWPLQALDFVFYRGVAGYLVRPVHPIVTLLALVLLVSAIRSSWRSRRVSGSSNVQTRAFSVDAKRSFRGLLDRFGHEVLDTLVVIWPGKGEAQLGRRFESNVYRVLVVCALFGLANSNPTLRQMLDAVR